MGGEKHYHPEKGAETMNIRPEFTAYIAQRSGIPQKALQKGLEGPEATICLNTQPHDAVEVGMEPFARVVGTLKESFDTDDKALEAAEAMKKKYPEAFDAFGDVLVNYAYAVGGYLFPTGTGFESQGNGIFAVDVEAKSGAQNFQGIIFVDTTPEDPGIVTAMLDKSKFPRK